MIVALEDAKRRLVDMEGTMRELGNQLRIDEARARAADLERETLVQDFWADAEKSSKKLQEIKPELLNQIPLLCLQNKSRKQKRL